jgi:hypothetical protein
MPQFNIPILPEWLVVEVASWKPEGSFAAKIVRRNQEKRSRIHIPQRYLRVLAGGPQCIEERLLENVSLELGRKERVNGERIASFGSEESDASHFVECAQSSVARPLKETIQYQSIFSLCPPPFALS